jgi:phage/plasmid-associated DNA primase
MLIKFPIQSILLMHTRRVIIITFSNRFENALADKQLMQKLTTQEERAGIFNILMTALRRTRKMEDIYINEKTIEEKPVKYQRAHNPVKAFFEKPLMKNLQKKITFQRWIFISFT